MNFIIEKARDKIDYMMLDGSPQFSITPDGMEATAEFVCKSGKLIAFLGQLYGRTIWFTSQGNQHISLPMMCEYRGIQQGELKLWLDGVAAVPWDKKRMVGTDPVGSGSGTIHIPAGARGMRKVAPQPHAFVLTDYDYFKITAHFTDRDPFIEEMMDLGGAFGTIETDNLWWRSDHVKVAKTEAPSYIQATGDWNYSIKRTRAVPIEAETYRGSINTVLMKSNHMYEFNGGFKQREFAVGTILYVNAAMTPVFVPWGNFLSDTERYIPYWRIDYKFLINEEGWNTFPRVKDAVLNPVWDGLEHSGGANYDPYPEQDLNKLLFISSKYA